MCKICYKDENARSWDYIGRLVKMNSDTSVDASLVKGFTRHLERSAQRVDENGWHPFQYSLYSRNLETVQAIYNAYPAAIYAKDHRGRTAMDLLNDSKFRNTEIREYVETFLTKSDHDFYFSESSSRVDLISDAYIEPAPGIPGTALRIQQGSAQLTLDGSYNSDLTLAVGVRLKSIVKDSHGHLIGFKRSSCTTPEVSIVMHSVGSSTKSYSLQGLGLVLGDGDFESVWEDNDAFPVIPYVGEWIQLVATFTAHNGCDLYVNGMKAPKTLKGDPLVNNLYDSLVIGGSADPCDCWINEVKVFHHKVDDVEIGSMWSQFYHQIYNGISVPPKPPPTTGSMREYLSLKSEPLHNVALNKSTSCGSLWRPELASSNAVNGNTEGYGVPIDTIFHTNHNDQWWKVNLGTFKNIKRIRIYNRGEEHLHYQLNNFTVEALLNGNRVWHKFQVGIKRIITFELDNVAADEVKISRSRDDDDVSQKYFIVFSEVQVFASS